MKVRRVVSALVAVAAGAALLGTGVEGAQAAPSAGTATRAGTPNPAGTVRALFSTAGFQEFTDSVTAQVHATYPNAQLTFVDASSPTGPTTRIADVTTWTFTYLGVTADRQRLAIAATVHLPSWTASITAARSPIFGFSLPPVTMSPFQAALLMRIAGYRGAYDRVYLGRPTMDAAPQYTFYGDGGAVTVDTVTRAVTPGS